LFGKRGFVVAVIQHFLPIEVRGDAGQHIVDVHAIGHHVYFDISFYALVLPVSGNGEAEQARQAVEQHKGYKTH